MANGGEDSRALQEFRRNFFGISREHAPMPESYLRELQRLVGAASAHLGVVVSSNERHAYWIDGRSLASIHRRALIARWLLIDLDRPGCGCAWAAGLPSFSCWSVFGPF